LFGILAIVVALVSLVPYVLDTLARKTTPHMYSWLIWALLQLTAAVAILRENTLLSAAGTLVLGAASAIVFLLSFKYGTKNITRFDKLCLVGALLAIGVWIFLENVLLSIILVTVIDFMGFLPTYRKAYEEPYSETAILYFCSMLSNIFSLFAITHHSWESSLYVSSLVVSNAILIILVATRRRLISPPSN
jgi:hypothetical protein